MSNKAGYSDDGRRKLSSKFKRAFRNPWAFRLLMLVWKIYDHFSE
ncbi:hypothetical protein [Luteimonas sp. FCS-9]|nr:hypothetical protein [Luteimonas sp. FCS-9]